MRGQLGAVCICDAAALRKNGLQPSQLAQAQSRLGIAQSLFVVCRTLASQLLFGRRPRQRVPASEKFVEARV